MTEEEIKKAQKENPEKDTTSDETSKKEAEKDAAKTELELQKAKNEAIKLRHEEIELELKKEDIEIKREELQLKKVDFENKREEIRKQSKKEMIVAVSTAAVKLVGIAVCCITAATFVGSSLRMMYQEQTIPPKSLGEGLKFITSLGTKLI